VAGIGDFDRNGHSDLAVGCPYSQDGDGFVAIYSGSAAGISNTPERTIAGVNNFGWSVSGAGDIKGTGQIYMVAGEEYGGSYLYATPCDTLYYADDDKDGYGDPGQTTLACIQPPGYASDNSDCNDAATEINPGAEEACNGVDDNCDGHVDEGCPQPVADAGTDKQVVEGDLVKLDGSASTPAEASRQITAYSWTQIDGPGVSLSNAGSARASFMTPPVHAGGAVLHFQLTVEDTIGLTATDEVTVTIQDNGIAGFPDDVLTFMGATGHPMGVKIQGGAILLNVVPVDPSGLLAADNSPDALIYGLLDITVWVPTPGSEADVTFYFSSPAEGSHVWCRYNSVDGWSDYSAHSAFDADRRSITIHLVDGENGDDDHCANNIIENESGLGVFSLTPAGDDTDPGSGGGGGGGGCFINALKDIVF